MPTTGLSNAKISNPKASPEISTDYTLVVSNGFCADTLKQHIAILSSKKTVLPEVLTCKNMPVEIGINITPNPTIEYLWFPNNNLVNSNLPNPIANPDQTTNYYMYLYNGKCWDLYSQLVQIYSDSLIKNNDTTICSPETITVNAGFSGDFSNYIWSTKIDFSDTLNKSLTDTSLNYFVTKPITIYLKASNKLCDVIDSIRIGILSDSSFTLPNFSICTGDSIEIGLPKLYGKNNTYSWSPSIYLNNSKIPNPIASPIINTNYVLIASNGFCKDTIKTSVLVNSLEMTVTEDTTICKNSSVFLYAFGNEQLDNY